jgi:hypothetical protein
MRAVPSFAAILVVCIAISLVMTNAASTEIALPERPRAWDVHNSPHALPPIPRVKDPAEDPATIKEAYEFVGEHPEISRYIPCFCACSKTKHHRSIEDCYIKSRRESDGKIRWSGHAAECFICITVAQEARRSFMNGMDLLSIHAHIERDLAPKFKYHTPTPDPPKEASASDN